VDLQGKTGMKLSEIPEQDSYSYATAFIYLGAKNQKELMAKFKLCREHLRFQFRDLTVPPVLSEKALEKVSEAEPDTAIQVITVAIDLTEEKERYPGQSGVQELSKP
jgi:hypothetical protein